MRVYNFKKAIVLIRDFEESEAPFYDVVITPKDATKMLVETTYTMDFDGMMGDLEEFYGELESTIFFENNA